jgi:chaperonin GroES
MKAVGIHLVIEPIKIGTEKTKGGLILSEKDREDIRYREGTIVSVGELVPSLKKGDKIYYDRHAGNSIEYNKETYKVIKMQDVVVVL